MPAAFDRAWSVKPRAYDREDKIINVDIMDIFKIRKNEYAVFCIGLVIMAMLNVLMVEYKHELFTRGGNLGFWTIFHNNFDISGYDPYMYVTISRWKIYYTLSRHPLITPMLYPAALLNDWLMDVTGQNCAIYIVAVAYSITGAYTFLFIYRMLHKVTGVAACDALLLTLLFFSMAHVMTACFVPDHFALSLFLLALTALAAGTLMAEDRRMPAWLTALLATITAGVTLTNAAKTWLAAWWTNGKAFWNWRYITVSVVMPIAILGGSYWWQYENMYKPDQEIQTRNIEKRMKKDKKFAKKFTEHKKWMENRRSFNNNDNSILEWVDTKNSRIGTVVENLFGESVQLHEDHLLGDTNISRPVIIRYRGWYNYLVEAVFTCLFVLGCWAGRHERFFRMVFSWFAVDMLMHIVLGFALTEVYIMTAHWALVVPVAYAFLLRATTSSHRLKGLHAHTAVRIATAALSVWLASWNVRLLIMKMG